MDQKERAAPDWLDQERHSKQKSSKKVKGKFNDTGKMFYQQAEDESYRRYKHLCYRNLILEALLSFGLGLLIMYLLKLR